jgi:uroporphyrinogen-III synthase
VVTRSRTQASDLAAGLNRLGARVLPLPTIAIEAPADLAPLEAAVAGLAGFDWIVFGSTNAVEHFFAALDRAGADARRFGRCQVAAVGSATVAALRERGIVADLAPERAISAALFAALRERQDLAGLRVLLPRADIAPPELPDRLRAAGAEVVEVVAYRTVPAGPQPEVFAAFRNGEVNVVTFTSSSTVRNFAAMARQALGKLPRSVVYVSIGPETSKTAAAEGLSIAVEASEHTVAGLLAALVAQAKSGTL